MDASLFPQVLPTPSADKALVFRDVEDGFEVAYPRASAWLRTQPLPELLGGAPARGTRFAATDMGQSAVIAVTCTPVAEAPAWPRPVVAPRNPRRSSTAAAAEGPEATYARRVLESRATELGWSSVRLTAAEILGPDRVYFTGKAYLRRVESPRTGRGDAAAATRISRGDESRPRRGYSVETTTPRPRRGYPAETTTPRPRRGYSAETSRGRDVDIPLRQRRRGRDADIPRRQRRRGRDADIPRRRVAAATWIFR